MKLALKNSLIACGILAASALSLPAATITFSGVVTNDSTGAFTNEVVHWRTPSQPKSMDLDGNNIYGSFGAIIWGTGANLGGGALIPAGSYILSGTNNPGSLGWAFVGQTVNPDLGIGLDSFSKGSYVEIDNLAGSGLLYPALASISAGNGTVTLQFNGGANDYTNRTVRLGMMVGFQEPGATQDENKLITVTQTAGAGEGSASTTTIPFVASVPDIYFFDLTNIVAGDQVTVTCYASSDGTSAGSLAALGTIMMDLSVPPGSFPTFLTQPQGSTNNVGDNYSFVPTVSGAAPLTYSWTKNGSPVSGGTNLVLALKNLQTTDSGAYRLIVTNVYGAVTSAPAQLLVNFVSAGVSQQPVGGYQTVGGSFTMNVTGTGSPVLSYQWYRATMPVGGNSSTLALSNLQVSDSGSYTAVIANTGGSVTSSPAILTVSPVHPIYANLRQEYVLNGLGNPALFTNSAGIWQIGNDDDFNPTNATTGGPLTDQTGQGGSGIEAYGGTDPLGGTGLGNFPMVGDSQFFDAGSVPRADALAVHPGLDQSWNGFSPMTYPYLAVKFTATTALPNVGFGYRLRVVNNNGANDGVVYSIYNTNATVLATNLVPPGGLGASIAAGAPVGTLQPGQSVWFYLGDNQNLSGDETFLTLTLENLGAVLAPPALTHSISAGVLTISWPGNYNQYILQSSPSLTNPTWTTVPGQANTSVNVNLDPTVPAAFYRLVYNYYY